MTQDLIALLQAYLTYINKPNNTWPKVEMVRYTAIEYTVDTLCHSLYSNRNCLGECTGRDATWVVDRYLDRVYKNYNTMCLDTDAADMKLFWYCCIECAEELRALYFDC